MSSTSNLPGLNRRAFVAVAASAAVCMPALAQHAGHGAPSGSALPEAKPSSDPFVRLQGGTPHHLTTEQIDQRKVESPAPKGPQGRWTPKAALPLPRSEMAWATAWAGRMHIVGGYGEGRVDRAYHHVYDPGDDRWFNAAPLPRGANHVAVVADAGRVYALGGFIEQNRNPDPNAFFYDVAADKWTTIAPLPRSRGAAAAVALDGKIHLIGGAGAPTNERASVGWHEVYDPQADKWEIRKALPAARDHVGAVTHNGRSISSAAASTRLSTTPIFTTFTCLRSTHGRSARHCPPRVPAMASSSTATASSRWAANMACRSEVRFRKARYSVRWRVTIPRRTPGRPMRR